MVELSVVFGILGICVALFLFLSPIPTIRRIVRARNSLEYSQLPYLAQVVESSFWSLWAIAQGDRLEMLINNLIGITFMTIYVIIFTCFVSNVKRNSTYLQILVSVVLVTIGIVVLLFVENSTASLFLSIAAVVLNCIKYASPLSVAKLVIQTKSVTYMPLPLTIACMLCSILWGMYGVLLNDIWIIVPNACGVVCSTMQIILWCCYCKRSTGSKTSSTMEKEEKIIVVCHSTPLVV